jgi:hypothetical protein
VYPHVNVGVKHGVCRDFAVLGYCEKGLDCEKQHVKECPDFADTGACPTKGCKLPHVIRAKHQRTPAQAAKVATSQEASSAAAIQVDPTPTNTVASTPKASGEEEFISLTFLESSEDEEEDDEEDEGEEDQEDEDEDENMLSDEAPPDEDETLLEEIL